MAIMLVKSADWVVTMDPNRRMIRNGAVAIQDDKIVAVGKTSELEKKFKANSEINASGKIVFPGFIQGHVHNTQFLAKGLSAEVFLKRSLFERIFPYETNLTFEDSRWSSFACQTELIRRGTTTFIESGSYFPDAVAEVAQQTGMRAIVARSAADVHASGIGTFPKNYVGRETQEQTIARGQETVKKWNGAANGRIRAWFALRFLQACSDELIVETKKLADEYGVGFQTHAGHSKDGIEATIQSHGMRDVERLASVGALSPNFLAVHMGWVTMKEILKLKENEVKIGMCPSSNIHSAYGTFTVGKFPEMFDLGLTVCLGSDGGIGGHFADIVREMYLAASIYKDTRLDPAVVRAEKVLEMATIDGAKAALWEDEIGSIEIGKKADLSIFNISEPEWVPLYNPVYALVYGSSGASADTVIVDGKVIMQDKIITTYDVKEVNTKIQEASDSLIARGGMGQYLKPKWVVE